jgi:hypothetical protein
VARLSAALKALKRRGEQRDAATDDGRRAMRAASDQLQRDMASAAAHTQAQLSDSIRASGGSSHR